MSNDKWEAKLNGGVDYLPQDEGEAPRVLEEGVCEHRIRTWNCEICNSKKEKELLRNQEIDEDTNIIPSTYDEVETATKLSEEGLY